LSHNAAAAMRKVSRVRREMQTYTPDEIRRVLRAADKDRNGHLWYLALSGLRRGEIAGLKWSDVDFDAGTMTIARNRVQVGAATVAENEPKTQSSRRTLPIDEGLVGVLKRASARCAQEKLSLGEAHADSGYVSHGRRVSRDDAKSLGLKVLDLEEDPDLQDLVLSVHHATRITFSTTAMTKVIENHNGHAYIEQLQQFQVVPGPPGQQPSQAAPSPPLNRAQRRQQQRGKH
jgi:integrase